MHKRSLNRLKRLLVLTSASLIVFSVQVHASGFQLWELDAVSIGDYHAGHAAIAEDASTSFNNPAGLIRIKNQQLIFGGANVLTNFLFRGTVAVDTLSNIPQSTSAQGGGYNFVPFGHYAAPLGEILSFGLSVVVPFGLETDYGRNTDVRYSAILSSVNVVDYAPALGIAIGDKLSVGLGLDIQHMEGNFNQMATIMSPELDTISKNTASDTALGFHLGALIQYNADTRFGITYHSRVDHHLKGTSRFTGPLANDILGGTQTSDDFKTDITLPAITSISLFHKTHQLDLLASLSYLQWNVIKQIILQNTAGILNSQATNTLPIVIDQYYRNSWNYTVGANYHFDDQWLVRFGIGYDQTPTQDQYRNLQLPDNDRIVLAIGAHYQMVKALGMDVAWTHVFAGNTRIANLSQTVGDETVTTNGSVRGNADVYALQLKWDIA